MAMDPPNKYQTPQQDSYRVRPLPDVEEFVYKVPNTDRIRTMPSSNSKSPKIMKPKQYQ